MHYRLCTEEKKVLLFIDIMGFGNLVKENSNIEENSNVQGLTLVFPSFAQHIMERYSLEYQKKNGFKFLWVSDTIIFSTNIDNVNILIKELIYLENQFYCGGMAFRGCICVGKLFHENNIWGEALVRAADTEKKAEYPRVIIKSEEFSELSMTSENRRYFVKDKFNDGFMSFKPFEANVDEALKNNRIHSMLKVYYRMLSDNHKKAPKNRKYRWEWMTEQLLEMFQSKSREISEQLDLEKETRPLNYTFDKFIEKIEDIVPK